MPFRSKAQKRYLYATQPDVAKRWEKYPTRKLPERAAKMEPIGPGSLFSAATAKPLKLVVPKRGGPGRKCKPHDKRTECRPRYRLFPSGRQRAQTSEPATNGDNGNGMGNGNGGNGGGNGGNGGGGAGMMAGKLKLATPAGDVTAPSDRAGLRGKLTVINGEGGPRLAKLVAKMHSDDTGKAHELREGIVDNKGRIPANEALFVPSERRVDGNKAQRCASCVYYQQEGRRRQGKCKAVHPIGKSHRLLVVKDGDYCMLWSGIQKSEARPDMIVPIERLAFRGKARMVKPRVMTTMGVLQKKLPYSTLPLTAPIHGSSPRWETPPVPDYADLYFQPESDKRNKLEREHQLTRKLATAKRNAGVYSFHGTPNAGEPELRYEPDKTLSNASVQYPTRPSKRAPTMKAPKLMARIAAGTTKQGSMYGSDEDKKKHTIAGEVPGWLSDEMRDQLGRRKKKKKKKKRKLIARRE